MYPLSCTQISDVEQIMGLMNTETVQIHAEAYDVAMDVSFPRGKEGVPLLSVRG